MKLIGYTKLGLGITLGAAIPAVAALAVVYYGKRGVDNAVQQSPNWPPSVSMIAAKKEIGIASSDAELCAAYAGIVAEADNLLAEIKAKKDDIAKKKAEISIIDDINMPAFEARIRNSTAEMARSRDAIKDLYGQIAQFRAIKPMNYTFRDKITRATHKADWDPEESGIKPVLGTIGSHERDIRTDLVIIEKATNDLEELRNSRIRAQASLDGMMYDLHKIETNGEKLFDSMINIMGNSIETTVTMFADVNKRAGEAPVPHRVVFEIRNGMGLPVKSIYGMLDVGTSLRGTVETADVELYQPIRPGEVATIPVEIELGAKDELKKLPVNSIEYRFRPAVFILADGNMLRTDLVMELAGLIR